MFLFSIINFYREQTKMSDLKLDIFQNNRKSRLSKKDYDIIPVNDFSDKQKSTSKIAESSSSIGTQINSSDVFKNTMKGIFQIGKRIQEKYSNKNIESSKNLQDKSKGGRASNTNSVSSMNNKKWKNTVDRIDEEKNEDDDNPHNKEDVCIGTSSKYISYPIVQNPIIYHPQDSRMLSPCNSRIIFPPPVVHVRPGSAPKNIFRANQPIFPQPILQPQQSRVIYQENQNFQQHQGPPIRVHHPYPSSHPQQIIYQNQNLPQNSPIFFPIHHNPVPVRCNAPIKENQNQNQNTSDFNQGERTLKTKNEQANMNEQLQRQQGVKQKLSQFQRQQRGKDKDKEGQISAEEYQRLLKQQYQKYNNQNDQLLQKLSQLTEDQKRASVNQILLQQQLKNSQNKQVSTKEKHITKINKIIEKNVINKQNITNVQNVKNEQNVVNVSNQQNFTNMTNMTNMINQQNYLALQYLQNGYINQQMLQGYGHNLVQKAQRNSNRQILHDISNHKELQNLPEDTSEVDSVSSKVRSKQHQNSNTISPQAQLSIIEMKNKVFEQFIEKNIYQVQKTEEAFMLKNHINDLQQIKTESFKDTTQFLKSFDEFIDKYRERKIQKKKEVQKQKEQQSEEGLFTGFFSKFKGISSLFSNPQNTEKKVIQSKVTQFNVNQSN